MPTQKKTVRLSDASLDVLARNGSDIDSAMSRRLNAVLERYDHMLSEFTDVPDDVEFGAESLFSATHHCYHRARFGLSPLRLDNHYTEGEISPLMSDTDDTLTAAGDLPKISDLTASTIVLLGEVAVISQLSLTWLFEEAERLASLLPHDADVFMTSDPYGSYIINIDGHETQLQLDKKFELGSPDRPPMLQVTLDDDRIEPKSPAHPHSGIRLWLYVWREPDEAYTMERDAVPLGSKAIHINRRALLELAIRISPLAEGAINEHFQGHVGEYRKALLSLMEDFKDEIAIPAEKVSSTEHFSDNPGALDTIIDYAVKKYRQMGITMPAIALTELLDSYMEDAAIYLAVEDATLLNMRERITEHGIQIAPPSEIP